MAWLPTASDEVVNVATPPESTALPSAVAPSVKLTVPLAVDGVTVAVNVTGWPNVDGLDDDVSVVVVAVWPSPGGFTICVNGVDDEGCVAAAQVYCADMKP